MLVSPLLTPQSDLGASLRAVTKGRALHRANKRSCRHNLALLAINTAATAVAYVSLEVAYVPPVQPDPSTTCNGGGSYKPEVTLPLCAVNAGLTVLSWLVLFRYYSVSGAGIEPREISSR